MKLKRIYLVALILLVLLSVSAVSAADDSANNIIGEDNDVIALDEAIDDDDSNVDVLGENDNAALNAGETGTFTDLNKLINEDYSSNDTITLSSNYKYSDGDDDFMQGIWIGRGVTIDGNGFTLDGSNSARMFNVNTTNEVIIKNINFINGHATSGTIETLENGGAIKFSSDSTNNKVINCNFTKNTATQYGGAVYFNSTGEMTNCTFINNNATLWGGAVYFWDFGTVTNCNFTKNTATQYGGALFFRHIGDVSSCNFINNSAKSYSAIKFEYGTLSNCNFINNSATDYGAVVFERTGTVTNCNFINNSAKSYSAIKFRYGTLSNCNFINNSATDYGAVVFENTGAVTNCNFTGNIAATGSAIRFFRGAPSDTLSIFNSCFLNNRANAESLDIIKNDNNITIIFTGQNNLLNAIYSRDNIEVTFNNVTYWGKNGITTIDTTISGSNKAAGQNITVGVFVNDKFVLNDVFVTDENGMIVLDISAGENYYISVRHEEDSYYTEAETTISKNNQFNVNVTSQTTTSKTVNITAKSNIYNEFMPGKLLFLLPNGDEINATYAGNGTWWAVHTFDDCGQYKVNATYIGLDNVTIYNATITVNKASLELSASAKSFKFEDKVKSYSVTLKDKNGNVLKNKKVSLKVNGATYTATTNSKGVATFKLTKLSKKGTYNAVISFAGDKDYNKISKSAKLTVKAPAWKTIAKGSKDKSMVKKIQRALKKNGFYLSYKGRYLKVDGLFHKYTQMAVKQFQKAKKLKVTGKVDYATAKKLKLI